MIKMIVCDLDGTSLNHESIIPEETVISIKEIQRKGIIY